MLHDGDAPTGQGEHDQAGDVESAGVVAAGADDVDGPRRPSGHTGIARQGAESRGKGRDLGRGLALVGQRHEKIRLVLFGHLRCDQRGGRGGHLGGIEIGRRGGLEPAG